MVHIENSIHALKITWLRRHIQHSIWNKLSKRNIGCSSLFIIVINLLFVFRFDALTELGAFMRTEFLCVSILRVASEPRVKLASCKSALNSTDRSKAVVPILVLLFVALWFILRGDLLSFNVSFSSCVFQSF